MAIWWIECTFGSYSVNARVARRNEGVRTRRKGKLEWMNMEKGHYWESDKNQWRGEWWPTASVDARGRIQSWFGLVLYALQICLGVFKMEGGKEDIEGKGDEGMFREKETEGQATNKRWDTYVDICFPSVPTVITHFRWIGYRSDGSPLTTCEYQYR